MANNRVSSITSPGARQAMAQIKALVARQGDPGVDEAGGSKKSAKSSAGGQIAASQFLAQRRTTTAETGTRPQRTTSYQVMANSVAGSVSTLNRYPDLPNLALSAIRAVQSLQAPAR